MDEYAHQVGLDEGGVSIHKQLLTGGCVVCLTQCPCGFSGVSALQAAVVGFELFSWLSGTKFVCQKNDPNVDAVCALYVNPAQVFPSVYSKCLIQGWRLPVSGIGPGH